MRLAERGGLRRFLGVKNVNMRYRLQFMYLLPVLVLALGLGGCAELTVLRARVQLQETTIAKLRDENSAFQAAYYKIKEQYDKSQASSTTEKGQLQIELDRAKNLRTQQEKDLSDQLRTTQMEYAAYKNEAENLKAVDTRRIGELEANLRSMAAERDAALGKLKETADALRVEQQRSGDLLKNVAALKVDSQTKADRLSALEKELAGLQAQCKQLQAKTDEQAQQLAASVAEAKRSRDAAEKLSADLTSARAAVAKAQAAEGERQKLAAELENVKKKASASNLADDAALKQAAEQLKSQGLGDGVQIRLGSRGLRVIIPSDLAFEPNSVVLGARGKALLTRASKTLATLDNRNIKVEGHTDNQPVKDLPFADNWGLGSARADHVRDALMQAGLSGDHLEAVSRADKAPLADNKTEAGRAQNRRIEIVIGAPAKP